MEVVIRQIFAIPTLMHWRREVIENVFDLVPSKRLMVANRQYYRRHIADGSHIALVAEVDGVGVGCGALCLSDELPSPGCSTPNFPSDGIFWVVRGVKRG